MACTRYVVQSQKRNSTDPTVFFRQIVRDEGASSLARGLGPNLVRAILMNASQLASYDWFKGQILRSGYLEDGVPLHFTASFAAVSPLCRKFRGDRGLNELC